jgi:hypothetical protein
MHFLIGLLVFLYALAILGCLIATLIIEISIQQQSKRAADASVELKDRFSEITQGMNDVKQDLKKLYEWIITHITL